MCNSDVFLGFLAILFPPLPVWIKRGICSADSLINILLSCLGWLPGLLHAWYVIAQFPDPYDDYEQVPQHNESGRVTYVFVSQQPGSQQRPAAAAPKNNKSGATAGRPQNYGATNNNAASSSSAGAANGGSEGNGPPTYAEAVKGDNKIQSHD
ncbi:YqaE/Pmp3 family membrane protein [Microdochium nivale]|nr:YqaE/Pmp3 family membrane protein [Microdochium nivale]